MRQYEVTRGVKSRNSRSVGNWQSWRDFVTRMKVWFCHWDCGTIYGGVARFCWWRGAISTIVAWFWAQSDLPI